MIISLTVLSSFFTYLEVIKSKVKNRISFIGAPYSFILLIFGIWEIINLLTFDLGISYSLLYIFYVFSFITIILFFISNFAIFFKKNKIPLIIALQKLPLFLITIFLAIFFLFFYKSKLTWDADMWYWYKMINELHNFSTNNLSLSLIANYSTYLPIGIYQFGSSLPIFSRFYLFPYLSTFLFLYFVNVVSYAIIEKFLHLYEWKINLVYITVTIFIIFFYIFYDYDDHYPTIEGDWVSSAYLLLLSIPFVLNLVSIRNKYSFFFICFFIIFISENSYSFLPILIFTYLIFIFIYRKKYKFSITYFIFMFFLFIFSLYLSGSVLCLAFKAVDLKNGMKLLFCIPFLSYTLIFITSILFILVYTNKFYKIVFLQKNFVISLWKSNFLIVRKQNNWFVSSSFFVKIICLIFTSFILCVSVFDWIYNPQLSEFNLICSSISLIIFLWCNFVIISRNKIKPIYTFFFMYITLIYCIRLIMIPFGIPLFFILRMEYTSLFIFTNYILTIREIVFILLFITLSINFRKHFYIRFNRNIKTTKIIFASNFILFSSITSIPVPIIQSIYSNYVIPSFEIPSLLFNFGLSENSVNQLSKFNFENKLTFSDIYLPAINDSSLFNLDRTFYPPYNNITQFHTNLSYATYKDLNGDLLKIDDYTTAYSDDILPYYSFICLKSSDYFFINIMNTLGNQFKLIKNINNSVFIYKNILLNNDNQKLFLYYNSLVSNLPFVDKLNNYIH